jgi:hypothetical protein
MLMKEGEIVTEPYIPVHGLFSKNETGEWTPTVGVNATSGAFEFPTGNVPAAYTDKNNITKFYITIADHENYNLPNSYADMGKENTHAYEHAADQNTYDVVSFPYSKPTENSERVDLFDSILVDYYVERTDGATQIEITADKFGGNYYLEAETLFRT